jgi:hypothetical protein
MSINTVIRMLTDGADSDQEISEAVYYLTELNEELTQANQTIQDLVNEYDDSE